jgi:hypothetical protein
VNTQKFLPSPPGDEFGNQQLVAPSAPPADFLTTENEIEIVTVTASRPSDWGPLWMIAAIVGAVWYLTSD